MATGQQDWTTAIDIFAQGLARVSTITKAPEGTTQVNIAQAVENAAVVMHTVPVGKTFFLTNFAVNFGSRVDDGFGNCRARDGDDVDQFTIANFQNKYEAGSAPMVSSSYPFVPPIEIPAGWDIILESFILLAVISVTLSGWEE